MEEHKGSDYPLCSSISWTLTEGNYFLLIINSLVEELVIEVSLIFPSAWWPEDKSCPTIEVISFITLLSACRCLKVWRRLKYFMTCLLFYVWSASGVMVGWTICSSRLVESFSYTLTVSSNVLSDILMLLQTNEHSPLNLTAAWRTERTTCRLFLEWMRARPQLGIKDEDVMMYWECQLLHPELSMFVKPFPDLISNLSCIN